MTAKINKRIHLDPFMVVGEASIHGRDWSGFLSKLEQHFKTALTMIVSKSWDMEAALCREHNVDYGHKPQLVLAAGVVQDVGSECVFNYVVVTGVLHSDLTYSEVLNGLDSKTNTRQCFPSSEDSITVSAAKEQSAQRFHERWKAARRLSSQVTSSAKWSYTPSP